MYSVCIERDDLHVFILGIEYCEFVGREVLEGCSYCSIVLYMKDFRRYYLLEKMLEHILHACPSSMNLTCQFPICHF